jgi:hypothetical protein
MAERAGTALIEEAFFLDEGWSFPADDPNLNVRRLLPNQGCHHPRDTSHILISSRIALRWEPTKEKGSSPRGEIASFTSRGLGVATIIDTFVSGVSGRMFFTIERIMPLYTSGGRSR